MVRPPVLYYQYHKPTKFSPPGLQIPEVTGETPLDLNIFSCLDAFTLVLGPNKDIIFVSENVSNYIGLSQVFYMSGYS